MTVQQHHSFAPYPIPCSLLETTQVFCTIERRLGTSKIIRFSSPNMSWSISYAIERSTSVSYATFHVRFVTMPCSVRTYRVLRNGDYRTHLEHIPREHGPRESTGEERQPGWVFRTETPHNLHRRDTCKGVGGRTQVRQQAQPHVSTSFGRVFASHDNSRNKRMSRGQADNEHKHTRYTKI